MCGSLCFRSMLNIRPYRKMHWINRHQWHVERDVGRPQSQCVLGWLRILASSVFSLRRRLLQSLRVWNW